MIYYVMLLGASFLFGSQFMVTKSFEKNCGKTLLSSIEFSVLYSLFAGVIFLTIKFIGSGFTFTPDPFSLLMALGLAVVNILSGAAGLKTLSLGDIAVYSLFMMLGGMIVPFVAGVLFLHEKASAFNIVGLLIMILALSLPVLFKKKDEQTAEQIDEKGEENDGKSGKKGSFLFYLLCSMLFLLNGFSSTFSKFNSVKGGALGAEFTVYTFGIQFVLAGITYVIMRLFFRKENETPVILKPKAIGCGAAFGAINGTAFLLSSIAAENIPAVAQYPLITGATIIFSSILAAIIYKEKPTKIQLVQIVISFAATVLFMF